MERRGVVAFIVIAAATALSLARACGGGATTSSVQRTAHDTSPAAREAPHAKHVRALGVAEAAAPSTESKPPDDARRTARLTVLVVAREDRGALAGARVLVLDVAGHRDFAADARGRVTFDVVPGQADLGVVAPGRARRQDHVSIDKPEEEREYVLDPGAAAVGRITDAATHAPVAGAAVAVRIGGFDGFSSYVSAGDWEVGAATTAADGSFAIDGLAPGQVFSLHASADGYADGERPATPYVPGPYAADLALDRGGAIRGRVVDEASAAAAGIEVVCRPAWERAWLPGPFGNGERRIRSDADGRFSFAGLDAGGIYLLRAAHGNESVTPAARVAAGSADDVTLRFETPATLRVRWRGASTGDVVAEVLRVGPLGERDSVGSVAADGEAGLRLSPGKYIARVVDETLDPFPAVDVGLSPGEERVCEIGKLGGALAGRVVDGNGDPVVAASVVIVGVERRSATVATDERGEFTADGLPAGPGAITVSHDGFLELRAEVNVPGPRRDWPLVPTCKARVRLPLEASGRRVRVDVDSRSLSPDEWIVDGWELGNTSEECDSCDPAEALTVDVCVAGPLRLRVRVDGFVTKFVESASARGEDFDVVVGPLVPGTRIAGRVVDPDGAPVGNANVEIATPSDPRRVVWTDQDGRFRTDAVEPGTVRLAVSARVGFLARTFAAVVHGMDDAPVTIVLYRGGFVDVVAVDPRGAPAVNREFDVRDENGAQSAWGVRTDDRGRARLRLNPGVHRVATDGADTATVTVAEGVRQSLQIVVR